jgi:hypothetical protein
VLGEEHGEALGGTVVCHQARDDGGFGIGEGFEAAIDFGEELGAAWIVIWDAIHGVLGVTLRLILHQGFTAKVHHRFTANVHQVR